MRDEVDQGAHARGSITQLDQAHQERSASAPGSPHLRVPARHGADSTENSTDRGRRGRPDTRCHKEAEQRRDDGRDHPGIQAVFRWHAGDGGKRHTLRQHTSRAGSGRRSGRRSRLCLLTRSRQRRNGSRRSQSETGAGNAEAASWSRHRCEPDRKSWPDRSEGGVNCRVKTGHAGYSEGGAGSRPSNARVPAAPIPGRKTGMPV